MCISSRQKENVCTKARVVSYLYVDGLKIESEPSVGTLELGSLDRVWQISKALVLPLVQRTQRWACTTLCIELDLWHSKSDEAGKKTLRDTNGGRKKWG